MKNIDEIVAYIKSLEYLPKYWDCGKAERFKAETIDTTISYLKYYHNPKFTYDLIPNPDGSIKIRYILGDCHLEIKVNKDLTADIDYEINNIMFYSCIFRLKGASLRTIQQNLNALLIDFI